MNLVGKIFVMLILVMSLVFMAFAVAVFVRHKDWNAIVNNSRDQNPVGLLVKIDDEYAKVRNLTVQRQRLEADRDNERAARERAVAQLTSEVETLQADKQRLTAEEQRLTEDARKAVAAMHATQNTLEKLRDEIGLLRGDIAKAQKERDDAFKSSVKVQDELAQAQGELDRLKPKTIELAEMVRKYELMMQDLKAQLDKGPPRVNGRVLASNESGRVEISLGFDDGLQQGHELSVYRYGPTADTSKYLGEIRVLTTEADSAIAEVIPGTKRGTIQKDDRVNTRLN